MRLHTTLKSIKQKLRINFKKKRIWSDLGGEYSWNEFDYFCAEYGIIHESTPPYSTQSNGVVELKICTLIYLINVMLDMSGLSRAWWGGYIDIMSCHE